MKLDIRRLIGTILFFNIILALTAQDKTIYYGAPLTGGAEIHVANDGTYEIILNYGEYKKVTNKENEFIAFNSPELEKSWFGLIEDNVNKNTESTTVHFLDLGLILFDFEDVFIGYKTLESDTFYYLNLSFETQLFNTNPDTDVFQIKIPSATEIELIYRESYSNTFFVNRFKTSPSAANVYCNYVSIDGSNGLLFSKLESTGNLVVNPDLFSTENPPGDYVKRIASNKIEGWDMPIYVEQEAYKKFDNPELSYQPIPDYPIEFPSEFPKVESLDQAISILKNDETKILLIFNQILDNNAEFYFEEFISVVDSDLANYPEDNPLEKFIIYLAKPEDRTSLNTYGAKGVNEVIALNSSLAILYSEYIQTERFDFKYSSSFDNEFLNTLLMINAISQINSKSKSATLTAKDFLELGDLRNNELMKSCLEVNANNYWSSVNSYIIGSGSSGGPKTFYKPVQLNLQKINSSRLKEELSRLIKKHKNDTNVDLDFAKLALDYIQPNPFFNLAIGMESPSRTQEDYEFCLYLSRFSFETKNIQTKYSRDIPNHISLLKKVLERTESKQYPELVVPAMENLLQYESYELVSNYTYLFHSFEYLLIQKRPPYDDFDKFFKTIVLEPEDYLEQLETFFQERGRYYTIMNHLKHNLSQACNSFSWSAVSNKNHDKKRLKRALEWSEMSLAINPENHYFLDTYAHLLYFTGNKEEAIQTQSKAIAIASKRGDQKNLANFNTVLTQMKDGTL